MKSLIHELRILLSEHLFALAVRMMPHAADEREPLEQAHRIYRSDVAPMQRWMKFPA